MDVKHPLNFDPQPKRRKSKDNPYNIFTVGKNSDHPRYFLAFDDPGNAKQCLEIPQILFEAFNQFELDDLSHMNEADRHYEQREQTEATLNRRVIQQPDSVEQSVLHSVEREELYNAIQQLSAVQRRRLVSYYFGELTYEKIAKTEGCSIMSVKRSIDAALKKLKILLR